MCLYGFQARAGFYSSSSVCKQIKRMTACNHLHRQSLGCFLLLILLRLVLMLPSENILKPLKVFMYALLRPQKLSAGGKQAFHFFHCHKGSKLNAYQAINWTLIWVPSIQNKSTTTKKRPIDGDSILVLLMTILCYWISLTNGTDLIF